ncbi:MAG TPA: ATP-binding cassette domain-containing protein [Bosea sp. (in: a-proteobacteria)]|jgi:ABC-type bacteriocin/lantibiotic exporter with double-glycine peptidase domain|uniref:ATP-binding cassette domain-containing protein n=1 Tax=Bosea sp. (in: a-proteobacteria) TaxID=1871050 RepID=UPI002DDD6591|nr:ATP-binding cassette domain-containing protein [Bosea sp. (in: a-proteobacteria)]HEV2553517.1 ATP-binding cassette domain-containing protein [Bosea sp. (in: a-proteobacteria)]
MSMTALLDGEAPTRGSRAEPNELGARLDRIERLLDDRFSDAGDDAVLGALDIAARALGTTWPKLPAPATDEPLDTALHRLGEQGGLLARPMALDDRYLASGTGPVIGRRSDGAVLALVRKGRGWLVHEPSGPAAPRPLDQDLRKALPASGFQIGLALPAKALTTRELLAFGWRSVLPDLAGYGLLTALAGLVAALIPVMTGAIVGTVVPGRELGLLIDIALFLCVLAAMNVAVSMASQLALLRMRGRLGSMLRAAAIDRAVRMPAGQHAPVPPPIMVLAIRAVEGWHRGVWSLGLGLVASLLMALPSLFVMATTLPGAALAVLVAGGLAFAAAWLIGRRQQALMIAPGPGSPVSWMATAYETFFNIDTVRATAAETAMFNRWAAGFASLQVKQLRSARLGAWSAGIGAAVESLFILVAIGAVVLAGALTEPDRTISFVVAAGVVVGAVSAMIASASELSMLALQRRIARPLLLGVPGVEADGEPLADPQGAVSIVSLSYRHDASSPAILQDVDLAVAPGQYVGIVGPSGSGKSTLIRLILGLTTPEAGAVFLDGVDTRKLDMAALRRRIGIVGQGASLFPGTLRDNVALGAGLRDAEIWDSLRLAGIDRDIAAMPLGLGTVIGDTNPMLSGGQVQRLLFARAIATRPKLVILDEATSALDPAAQATVTNTIRELGITVIAVAHRLETLQSCDCIYMLERGRIVEKGGFDELASGSGPFAAMLGRQG